MNTDRRLYHRAWWRFFLPASILGALAYGLCVNVTGFILDWEPAGEQLRGRGWLVIGSGIAALSCVSYLVFVHSVRKLVREAVQQSAATDEPQTARR